MTARILDGKIIAQEMRDELAREVAALKERGIVPGLGVLLVGDNPASRSYVTGKEKACAEAGIFSSEVLLPAAASRQEILDVVRRYNEDPRIHGILVQLPLPDTSMEQAVIDAINPLWGEPDEAKRIAGWKAVSKLIADNAYVLPLLQYAQPIVHSKSVNVVPHKSGALLPHLMMPAA